MAFDPCFQINGRIEWTTRFPQTASCETSSEFMLLGLKWCLKCHHSTSGNTKYKSSKVLTVSLVPSREGNVGRTLRTPIGVVNYLRDPIDAWKSPVGWEWRQITQRKCVEFRHTHDEIYKHDSVTIVCLFYGADPCTTETTKTNPMASTTLLTGKSDLEFLSRDLGKLLDGGEQLPDVSLTCGDRTFPVHRCVLSARSEVFAAMFRNKMAESETGSVDVKDFDPDVVRQFLQYLYTGKLPEESKRDLASLSTIADKYAVDSLKVSCTERMLGHMTEDNCVEYLTVGDLHGSKALKEKAITFIMYNPKVMLRKEWAELTKRNPELSLEVLHRFGRSKSW